MGSVESLMYIDGFLLALPKTDVDAYRRWARRAGKVWRKHGALEVKECVGDQLTGPDSAGKVHSPFGTCQVFCV